MGFRFRKSFKIGKGLRLNLGKRGASLSIGGRGGSLTIGSSGTRATVGIPGSGISYSKKLGGSTQNSRRSRSRKSAYSDSKPIQIKATVKIGDDGTISITDQHGNPLPSIAEKEAFRQNEFIINKFLKEEETKYNREIEDILNIHLKTPPPNREFLFIPEPFSLPKPRVPILKKTNFFQRWVKPWRESIRRCNEALQTEYGKKLEDWESARTQHFEAEERRRRVFESCRSSDPDRMTEFLEYIFSQISFPKDTTFSFHTEPNGKTVWIDVDLPEIEDLPSESVSVAKTGKRLLKKKRSETQIRKDYMTHIHGVIFRVIGQIFMALKGIDEIICSGYSQRLDKTTGNVHDEYLISVRVTRNEWEKINFANLKELDMPSVFGSFDIRRKMTKTGIFTAIEPFELLN